jgi:hypothetical protein
VVPKKGSESLGYIRYVPGKSATLKAIILAVILLLTLAGLPGCDSTQTSDRGQVGSFLQQGLYEECPPSAGARCLERLKQIAAGGFTLVLNYGQLYGSAAQELAYARQAQALGMKIIWAMHNPAFREGSDARRVYPDLAATCQCSDNSGFIKYIVRLVKDLPATWGYYVGDEVSVGDHAKVKAVAELVHQIDSSHPRLYIAGSDPITLGSTLSPFTDVADILGADYYPIGRNEPIDATAAVAGAVQELATAVSKQSAMVLQSFSWAEYPESRVCSPLPYCAPFPTSDEMRRLRELVLANSHPILLLWYSYFDILRSDHPADHWHDLIAAAGTSAPPTG